MLFLHNILNGIWSMDRDYVANYLPLITSYLKGERIQAVKSSSNSDEKQFSERNGISTMVLKNGVFQVSEYGSWSAPEDAPKAVSKVFIGVSAGMVLGVPVSSYLASTFSLPIAMSFFGIVNLITFLATIFMVPSMPVTERKSYGEQLSVLKKPVLWISMIGFILMNASIFGVFSYASDYLNNVSNMSWTVISLVVLVPT